MQRGFLIDVAPLRNRCVKHHYTIHTVYLKAVPKRISFSQTYPTLTVKEYLNNTTLKWKLMSAEIYLFNMLKLKQARRRIVQLIYL